MWNYRIVRKQLDTGEESFQVHEVYYNDDGNIFAISEEPISPSGETAAELV